MLKLCLLAAAVFLSVSCATVKTETSQISIEPKAPPSSPEIPYRGNLFRADGVPSPVTFSGNTYLLSFGPKLLELKASYVEKQEPAAPETDRLHNGNLRRYLNLLATSTFGGSGLTGEGELSYSPLNASQGQCACRDWPRMLRLGLRNRWGGLGYGGDYRSIERGFVSFAGAVTDQTRDEGELWGEHPLGPINIRGSIGESREKLLDVNGLRVTKSATTSLSINRSQWGGSLASSYGWVEQGPGLNQESMVFTNTLAGSYRPLDSLSLNPNFSIKEERNLYTGIKTDTPRTELVFAYAPLRDSFRLTGATSFAQSFNGDGSNNNRTFGTAAVLDWKIGKFLGKDDTLSFNFNYNQQIGFTPSVSSHNDLSGMLQLKITGF